MYKCIAARLASALIGDVTHVGGQVGKGTVRTARSLLDIRFPVVVEFLVKPEGTLDISAIFLIRLFALNACALFNNVCALLERMGISEFFLADDLMALL